MGELISTARQWPQAIEPYRRTIELDLNVALVHDNLGIALEEIGDHDQAIEEYVKARSVSGDDNFRPEALRSASQKHGMRGFREKQPQFALEHWTGWHGTYMLFRSHRSTQDWPIPLWQWRGYKRPLTLDQDADLVTHVRGFRRYPFHTRNFGALCDALACPPRVGSVANSIR